MNMTPLLAALAFGAAAVSAPVSAASTTFDFSNLTYLGGINSGFLPSETLNTGYWQCSSGDLCSSRLSNGLGGDLKYTANGITATATGFFGKKQVTVVQDHENGYNPAKSIGAGLGVYHNSTDSSDDNVTVNETLKLTFAHAVTLSGISLRSDGHNTSFGSNATFLLNGTSLLLAPAISGLNLTGTEFTFAYDNMKQHHGDQFYLGGITISPVPEPETYAMLLAGLGLMGCVARRRKTVV